MSDDLISRSEAIAFIKDHSYPVKYDRTSVENGMTLTGIECALRLLPAVARNILPAAVDDCVSRQAVIDCLKSISNMDPKERGSIVMSIELLPSVQPIVKSRTGHWVDIMVGDMPAQACDRCKTFYPLAYTGGGHPYCPNCGARMESEDNENE